MRAAIDRYDQKLSRSLELCLQKPWLSTCMRLVSISASGFLCFPIYAAAYFVTNSEIPLVKAVVAGECIQLPVIIVLRHITKRPRPGLVEKGDYYFEWNRYSFPSLHTSRAFMLGGIMYSFYHWALPGLLAVALLIAFSRLVLQKHYLSDVICGAIVGTFTSVVGRAL